MVYIFKKILMIIISGLILCTVLPGCSNHIHYVKPKEKVLKGVGGPGSAAQH